MDIWDELGGVLDDAIEQINGWLERSGHSEKWEDDTVRKQMVCSKCKKRVQAKRPIGGGSDVWSHESDSTPLCRGGRPEVVDK